MSGLYLCDSEKCFLLIIGAHPLALTTASTWVMCIKAESIVYIYSCTQFENKILLLSQKKGGGKKEREENNNRKEELKWKAVKGRERWEINKTMKKGTRTVGKKNMRGRIPWSWKEERKMKEEKKEEERKE